MPWDRVKSTPKRKRRWNFSHVMHGWTSHAHCSHRICSPTLAKLYVGFTRVTHSDRLRFWPGWADGLYTLLPAIWFAVGCPLRRIRACSKRDPVPNPHQPGWLGRQSVKIFDRQVAGEDMSIWCDRGIQQGTTKRIVVIAVWCHMQVARITEADTTTTIVVVIVVSLVQTTCIWHHTTITTMRWHLTYRITQFPTNDNYRHKHFDFSVCTSDNVMEIG